MSLSPQTVGNLLVPYKLPFARDADLVDSGVLLLLGPAGSWDIAGARSTGPRTGLAELVQIPAGQPATA